MNILCRFAFCAVTLIVGPVAMTSSTYAQSRCQVLWEERNQYYKNAGYCFKTARAINFFGNANCIYNNEGSIPFTQSVRNRIQQIRNLEQSIGCTP